MEILTRGQVNPNTWTDCKPGYFLFYLGRHYSSTLLVLMSLEKCFAVYFPLKSKTVRTVKKAKWSTGIAGVVLAGCDSVYLFVVESRELHGLKLCVTRDFSDKDWAILNVIDSVLFSFKPFVLMFITNFALVFMFMKAKCTSNSTTESTTQALSKSATRGTAMVVSVSVTFLILTAPSAVHAASNSSYSLMYNSSLYRVFVNITQYLNHSINGFLYCIVGSRFRQEFFKIIFRKENTMNSINSINTNPSTR